VFHVILANKKREEDYPEKSRSSQLAAWAQSNGLGPAAQNTGQRQEQPGRTAPVLQRVLPKLQDKNTKLQSHSTGKFTIYFFLHITWQIQSQTWKFHRVLMCLFPV